MEPTRPLWTESIGPENRTGFGRKQANIRREACMWKRITAALAVSAALALSACGGDGATSSSPTGGGGQVTLPTTSPTPQATGNMVQVSLGESSANEMFLNLSQNGATAGTVTFAVTNEGQRNHEFLVLKTDTLAADLPIVTFEGESDRIDEEAADVEAIGEIEEDELGPGASASLDVDLQPGHYVLLCNLKGHYRMGMRQDFQVG
jgi:uncharacterized cupredoxin-like copper-binding protein